MRRPFASTGNWAGKLIASLRKMRAAVQEHAQASRTSSVPALIDRVRFPLIDIDAGRVETGARQLDGERQPDIAEADDADARALRVNPVDQFVCSG